MIMLNLIKFPWADIAKHLQYFESDFAIVKLLLKNKNILEFLALSGCSGRPQGLI